MNKKISNWNKIYIIFFLITIILGGGINIFGLYNEVLLGVFLLLYILNIILLIYFLILKGNNKKLNLLESIFSLIFCIGGPWLALTGIGLSALNKIPDGIIVTVLLSYLLYYIIFWFYFILYKIITDYKKLALLILMNIFGTIGIFYLIIFCFYKSYFIVI